MERYLPGQPLPSLGELVEAEQFNGRPFSDKYTVAYMANLRAGMSQILAHFEATITAEGGEEKMSAGFMEHVRRHRKTDQEKIGA